MITQILLPNVAALSMNGLNENMNICWYVMVFVYIVVGENVVCEAMSVSGAISANLRLLELSDDVINYFPKKYKVCY